MKDAKDTCRTCAHCGPSYKGGYCNISGKTVRYGKDACSRYQKKERR